jgi:hypothetical protein
MVQAQRVLACFRLKLLSKEILLLAAQTAKPLQPLTPFLIRTIILPSRGKTVGKAKEPRPVKLIVSMFSGDETLLAVAKGALVTRYGTIDYESELLPFDHTSYYEQEFGPGLVRRIVAFTDLIAPQRLAEIKRTTNELEMNWAVGEQRRVNLDPGYISLSKMVLATTKNYSHRIYLGQGIYAEVTLHYRHSAFHPWEWTYPDYASPRYLEICGRIRDIYVAQLRARSA